MPITIDCPRCQTSLSAPEQMAGQYAFCPKCQGRMWVPQPSAPGRTPAKSSTSPVASVLAAPEVAKAGIPMPPTAVVDPMAPVKAAPSPAAISQPPLPPLPSSTPQGVFNPAANRRSSGPAATPVEAPPAVASPPASTRRVAQFITADVAQSQLTVAADGKLPELHLNVDNAGPRKRKVLAGGNSWTTVALISISLLLAVAMIMIDTGSAPTTNKTTAGHRIWIRDRYFGKEGAELKAYQLFLRRAQQAHDRGDRKAEREYYLKVLSLLRDENLHPLGRTLTGMEKKATDETLPSDQDLEERVSSLLGER